MAQVDPALALFDVKTMAERTELSISSRKAAMSLAVGFGGVALFLSGSCLRRSLLPARAAET